MGQISTNPRLFRWQNACCLLPHPGITMTPLWQQSGAERKMPSKRSSHWFRPNHWSRCCGGTCVFRKPRRHPVMPHLPTGAVTLSHIKPSGRHHGASERSSSWTRLSECKSIWIRLTRHWQSCRASKQGRLMRVPSTIAIDFAATSCHSFFAVPIAKMSTVQRISLQ